MRDTIKSLGGSGIRVNYGGGITRQLDTAVRQSILWGAKQASVAYNEMIGEELGCDGIEIDWHSNPRPSHEFMQGKQYSLNGKKTVNGKTYEDAAPALRALEDYGCLHFKTPIICGVSEPRLTQEELAELNRKNARTFTVDGRTQNGYEWKQDMRRLEAETRKQRNIRTIAEASGDKELVRQCDERIKLINKKYAQISKATGIKTDTQRMGVIRGANVPKNPLTTQDKDDIIKSTIASGAKKTTGWQDRHAEQMYEEICHRTTDVTRIANNTQFKESAVEEIKQHMFFKKHRLADGTYRRFDSDFEQAQAWDRLIQGNGTEADIVMLKHEYVELSQMRMKDLCYEEAHAIANKKHNWWILVNKKE